MNVRKEQNTKGFIGFVCSVASIFFYPFLVFQLAGIAFSYLGMKDFRGNPILTTWQHRAGMTIGIIYLLMFFYNLLV